MNRLDAYNVHRQRGYLFLYITALIVITLKSFLFFSIFIVIIIRISVYFLLFSKN